MTNPPKPQTREEFEAQSRADFEEYCRELSYEEVYERRHIRERAEPICSRDQLAAQEFLRSHGVTTSFHFTHADNLASILEFGLMSVTRMYDSAMTYVKTDSFRHDQLLDWNSTSILRPNAPLLAAKRLDMPGLSIIEMDAGHITESTYLCSPTNAARKDAQFVPGLLGLESIMRARWDVQAEVLIHSAIPRSWFRAVHLPQSLTNPERARISRARSKYSPHLRLCSPCNHWDGFLGAHP